MAGVFYFGCQIRVLILFFRVEFLDFGFPLFWCQLDILMAQDHMVFSQRTNAYECSRSNEQEDEF
jgi:hypothetical protein